MKLSEYSKNRLMASMNHWLVDREFAEPMFNYLVYGFEPGGFFKGWYANDATSIVHSHPGNTVEALKALTKWMINCMPDPAWRSHDNVNNWLKMNAETRRFVLEEYRLIYTEQEEIMMLLKGTETVAPFFHN